MSRMINRFRCIVLSAIKHEYIARAVAAHPRFELVAIADDPNRPDWTHERNQRFADEFGLPYVRNIEQAIAEHQPQVAVVSPEVERHCDLSARAADAGLHVVQDKPMSNRLAECDRLVEAIQRNQVKFLMWSRNCMPSVIQAKEAIAAGAIGEPYAIHIDFFFAKDAGPPKGSRGAGQPPLNWLDHQLAAHATGADGGLGQEPMGELQIEGIYPLAYIRALTAAEVQRVFARTATHFHQINVDHGVEDLATVTLEMDRGMLGTICLGRIGAASHPDLGEIKIKVLGTDGALVVGESRPEVAIYYRGQPEKEFRHRRLRVKNDFLLVENFANSIDGNYQTMLDARASRTISAVVEAAIESARSSSPVEVRR
jgi:predicted dehydrogenase